MLAPASFTQTIDRDAYIASRLIRSKKRGILRFTPAALAFSAVLIVSGLSILFGGSMRTMELLMQGMLLILAAAAFPVTFLMILPERIKSHAEQDFSVFDALSNHVTVTMTADDMTLCGDTLTRRVEYARVRHCVETDARFVLITDDDQAVILEKAAFAEREETLRFFRDVFARVKR